MNKPMFPIGVSSFGKLIRHTNSENENYLFVDKSLLIKDFIDAGDEISLVTRPRRFGKTINMSMLHHFFANKINNEETKGLFEGLKINKYPQIMKHQGQYPTIFLTLKEIRGKSFDEAFGILKEIFRSLFQSHEYLLNSDKISEEDKSKVRNFIQQNSILSNYKSSILLLTKLLYQYHDQKVIILLDEYDTPLNDAYVNNYFDDMRGLIATMFNLTFKGNDYLHKAMITGILKIAKSSLFSELNNVKVYSCIDSPLYAQHFGFTEDETDLFFKQSGLKNDIQLLKKMYNGYQIEDFTLYNPYSIVLYLNNAILYGPDKIDKALQPYWINSGGNHIIKDLIHHNVDELEPGLTRLINNQNINTPINPDIILGSSLKTNKTSFWSLLLIAGYLKIISKNPDDFGDMQFELAFPNEEIRYSIQNLMIQAVSERDIYTYTLAMKALVEGKVDVFIKFLKQYMKNTPSYFDTGDNYKESFFHGLLLGMAACLANLYVVDSNRESGDGRYDIAIDPKDNKRNGVIIEIKAANKNDDLDMLASDALDQIKNKSYDNKMKQKGVSNIIYLGIAFKRNEVVVKY